MDEKEIVVGIDLGTTNSCIAIWDNYKVEVIANDYGERTTPSMAHFFDENNSWVGLDAKVFLDSHPESTIYSIKRVIGLNYDSKEVAKYKEHWPFKLTKQDNNKIGIEINRNNNTFTVIPEKVSCIILKKLKEDAENFLKGRKIKKAVIAVPYYFNSSQKEATLTAAKLAGFEEPILINEPTAASMAYGFDKKLEEGEQKLLIFDLGGGTFDVSLLTIEEGIIDVICVYGDTMLGGNDIDNYLYEYIKKKIKENEEIEINKLNEIMEKQKEIIKLKCEFVKRNLTSQENSILNLPNFYKNKNISLEITRKNLEGELSTNNFFKKIEDILDKLFNDAKDKKKGSNSYNKSNIDNIILIGGSTRMPAIINFIEKYFNKKPITSFNPDESVAIGAAIRGETFFNSSPYLDSLCLIDVIPLNIRVKEGLDDKMEVILKRNTYIPCQNEKIFRPSNDFQKCVNIEIYEGENRYAKNNTLLGSFLLDITPKKSIDSKIKISFEIDELLFLHVSAEQIYEGKSKKICIKRKNQLLTDDEFKIEKEKIERAKISIDINENEKTIYSEITTKKNKYFSSDNIKKQSNEELKNYLNVIENYLNDFSIKQNNIHFVNIIIYLYNCLIEKKQLNFDDELKKKINKYLEKIAEIDIFYILNIISKYILDKSFKENITIIIAQFFYDKGNSYLIDVFKEKKNISFELFQLSMNLIDNLLVQNNQLKNNLKIINLISSNNNGLNKIKINDISIKITKIYEKNKNDNKYLIQILELFQTIVNLIKIFDDIEYINDFDILYRLGDNSDFSPYILEIMKNRNIYIEELEKNYGRSEKYEIFKKHLKELEKYSEEIKNVNRKYFKEDFENITNAKTDIIKKYEEGNPTEFVNYIIKKYPPISLPKSPAKFKLEPSLKILKAYYSKSFGKHYPQLKNKEELRKIILKKISDMYNNGIELEKVDRSESETEDEGDDN